MIAYNTQTLFNLKILTATKRWYEQKFVTDKQFIDINKQHQIDFYTPNFFVRFALFIFTHFAASASLGFISLTFGALLFQSNTVGPIVLAVIYGIGNIVVLEHFIKSKKHYNSGIDNALLYNGFASFAVALYLIVDSLFGESMLLYFGLLIPTFALAVIRYVDRFLTMALLFCIYAFIFLITIKTGNVAKLIMPMVIMLVSVIGYFTLLKKQNLKAFVHYTNCMLVAKVFFLLAFYTACNYFVIKESSQAFFNLELQPGEDIPLAIVFYILTAIVPIGYIYFGLSKKNKPLLWVGMLILAISVITFKYYFSLGHPEITFTISGIILITVAYFSIRYFNKSKFGITYVEDINEDSVFKTNAEALIMAQGFANTGGTEVKTNSDFGGGDFGGAGSGGNF